MFVVQTSPTLDTHKPLAWSVLLTEKLRFNLVALHCIDSPSQKDLGVVYSREHINSHLWFSQHFGAFKSQ